MFTRRAVATGTSLQATGELPEYLAQIVRPVGPTLASGLVAYCYVGADRNPAPLLLYCFQLVALFPGSKFHVKFIH